MSRLRTSDGGFASSLDADSADGRDDAAQRAVSDSFSCNRNPLPGTQRVFCCPPDCEPVTGSTRVALEKRNAAANAPGPAASWRSFTANVYDRYGNSLAADVKGTNMNASKIAAIVLIVAGVLGLVYGSFSYTKQTHDINVGPIEMSVKEKQTVNVPVWAGVAAIVAGGLLLAFGSKGR